MRPSPESMRHSVRMASREPALTRRSLLRGGAATGIVLGVSACARIPTSSGIEAVPVGSAQNGGAPYVRPRPPAAGASPTEIVDGFVQAGVGADDDYAIARSYLTAEARASWDPRAGVMVYANGPGLAVSAGGEPSSATLRLQAVSQVDQLGVRTVLDGSLEREIDVALELVDDQWRISRPPAGIFLSEEVFEILFTSSRLYRLDRTERLLVPDVRWVESQERVAETLRHLGGPAAPVLDGAVGTAVPEDLARQRAKTRPDAGGGTRIELPVSVAQLPAARRALAVAQIRATVDALHLPGDVVITSGAMILAEEDAGGAARAKDRSVPIGAGEKGIIALDGSGSAAVGAQLVPALAAVAVDDPCIATDRDLAAAITPDGRSLLVCSLGAGAAVRTLDAPGGLASPTVDRTGRAWTAVSDGSGELRAFGTEVGERDAVVRAPWLAGSRVVSLDMADDGTRLLVVAEMAGAVSASLCAVLRDAHGAPTGVTTGVPLRASVGALVHAAWSDEGSVLLLGLSADGHPQGVRLDLSGSVTALPEPPSDTVRMVGGGVSSPLLCADAAGALHRSDGSTWTAVPLTTRSPRYC